MCTQSGNVYVRSHKSKRSAAVGRNKSFRFQCVPHIQRIIGVCTNSTGTFGALRVDYEPPPVHVVRTTLGTDMAAIAPYMVTTPRRSYVPSISPTQISLTEDDVEVNLKRYRNTGQFTECSGCATPKRIECQSHAYLSVAWCRYRDSYWNRSGGACASAHSCLTLQTFTSSTNG